MRNLLILLTMLVGACSSTQESTVVPQVHISNSFNAINDDYVITNNLPYLAWWKQFKNKDLNTIIDNGLDDNLDIKMAISNVEQSQGLLQAIQLSFIPFVSLYAGYSGNPSFGNPGVFYGIWPEYVPNIFKIYKEQQQAKYNVEVSKAIVDGVKITLISQITSSYFTLVAYKNNLKLLTTMRDDNQILINLIKQQIKIGINTKIELNTLSANYELINQQINQTIQNIKLSQNSLKYLINENPGNVAITDGDNFNKINFNIFKPGALPMEVIHNRPDLLIAENTLRANYEGIGVAYSDLFPTAQLDTFFGAGSTNGTVASPNQHMNMNDAYLNWQINPTFFGHLQTQKSAYKNSVYQYIQTVHKILREVEDSYVNHQTANKNYDNTYKAYKDVLHNYHLQYKLYQIGIMSYSTLIINKLRLDELEILLNQAKLSQAIALVNLYQNLSGGYKYNTAHSKR